MSQNESIAATDPTRTPAPLSARQRRILGVLMEKARTTPDVYPLSLNSLTTGCNQKSNRAPLMNLTDEQVEDEIRNMRQKQLVAEVHGGGRVAKYRHFGYDYMGVKGVDAAVMTELLLRGEQTIGELRTRASRFDPVADLSAMNQIVESLIQRGLIIALTPAGRGQLISHNLYEPHELESLRASLSGYSGEESGSSGSSSVGPRSTGSASVELEQLRAEVRELRELIVDLDARLKRIEE